MDPRVWVCVWCRREQEMWCVYVMICLRIKKWELGLAFGYDQTFMSMTAPLMLRWADGGALKLQDFR